MAPPKIAKAPERQAARPPNQSDVDMRAQGISKRRKGYAATILTSPQGTFGSPSTTAQTTLGG
jgi:hypothetical protein